MAKRKEIFKNLNSGPPWGYLSWLLGFLSITFVSIALYVAYHGLIKWPNGDEGIYLSGGYQLANGYKPHVDHWWPQGTGINFIIAFFGRVFGFDLLSMRFLSLFCLSLSILISGWVLWRNIHNENKSIAFACFALCGLSCQVVLLYFGSSLGTKEGILSLLLILTAASYIRYFEKFTLESLITFCLSVFLLVIFKPNLLFATSFFIVHSLYFKKNFLTILKSVFTLGVLIFAFHFLLLGNLENFEKLIRDITLTSKDIDLRGYDIEDALRLLGQSTAVIALSVAFVIVAPNNLRLVTFTHPGSIILGYWLCNVFFSLLIFYPSLFPIYFYQFNLLLLLGLLLCVGERRWSASLFALLLMTALVWGNFYTQVSHRINDNSFARATGSLKSPTIQERLNSLPHDNTGYLFIGRYQHLVLESVQKQSVYSVGGTVNMDLLKPDRKTANDMRVIAASNMSDLLEIHKTVVVSKYAHKKLEETDMKALLYDKFELLICDELVCLFSKERQK